MPAVQPPLGITPTRTPLFQDAKSLISERSPWSLFFSSILTFIRANRVWVGQAVFVAAASLAVTLADAQPDAAYFVAISGNANETFWVTVKTATGFTLNSSNAGSTATVDYILTRG